VDKGPSMRKRLGSYGVWTGSLEGRVDFRAAACTIERLGFGSVWFPDKGGRDPLVLAATLLGATEHLIVGNGVARITARDADAMSAGARTLADAFPHRHVLGLGIGALTRTAAPLDLMRQYVAHLTGPDQQPPPPCVVLAAYGPGMLSLAGETTAGAHTYLTTPEHTTSARRILGPDRLLVVEQPVALAADRSAAYAAARRHVSHYLSLPYNLRKFRRLGFSSDELAHGGSDRLVESLVAVGIEEGVATLRRHLTHGADHVLVQVVGTPPDTLPETEWGRVAEALDL
jgi:probable F420-dependent oxidoreductase